MKKNIAKYKINKKRKGNFEPYVPIFASSSSLLHNFQPIRKTNKSPTTGDGALTF